MNYFHFTAVLWTLVTLSYVDSHLFYIKHPYSGLYWDASDKTVDLRKFTGSLYQQWRIESFKYGGLTIINEGNKNVLDMEKNELKANVITSSKYNETTSPKWVYYENGLLFHLTYLLTVCLDGHSLVNYRPRTKLMACTKEVTPYRRFKIYGTWEQEETCFIRHIHSQLVLAAVGNRQVKLQYFNSSANQVWVQDQLFDNKFVYINKGNGQALDISLNTSMDFETIITWPRHGSPNQQWSTDENGFVVSPYKKNFGLTVENKNFQVNANLFAKRLDCSKKQQFKIDFWS